MHEIRLAGRGGQGIVTAGELLGRAAVFEGRHAQAIPTFGPERRGALSSCTLRISEEPIMLKYSATSPDVVLVLDATIWHMANVFLGLRPGGTLLFNTSDAPAVIDEALRSGTYGYTPPADDYTLYTVDATAIALDHIKRPITNTALMGALTGATSLLKMSSVEAVIEERFGNKAAANIESARAAAAGLKKLRN